MSRETVLGNPRMQSARGQIREEMRLMALDVDIKGREGAATAKPNAARGH